MPFWLIAAALTLAAIGAILLFLPKPTPDESIAEHAADEAVYRDQLASLDREIERGSLDEPSAAEARAEIARRLLQARDRQEDNDHGRLPNAFLMAAVLAVPIVAWGFYGVIGEPDMPSQPLEARLKADPSTDSIENLIARAERALASNPSDSRGWGALAPIYMRVGRYDDAANAFRALIRLRGESGSLLAALGEAEIAAGGGIVSAGAKQRLERAVELEPKEPRARYFLALAKKQEGDSAAAVQLWNKLADSQKEGSPWFSAARQAAQLAAAEPAEEAARGPDREAVAAAADMSADERQAMIGQMVAGLDRRLEENGGSIDEWLRLINAYRVLGDMEKGKDAARRALEAFEDDESAQTKIRSAAEALSRFDDAPQPEKESETRS
ncbi:c-type cytochrome biogenesis protein CcmI [Notoacmeibacter sp. MSK16QG-6]|uniref:c-type cytochrome biogenesis protein CcmI n=1 Tax=Notoacmeibacter sp. MSK16QG-6 TaxID=2957982 RepID=UPI0020A07FE9|nr:c-type cytochrome biogenesis protein CcmI [Notoacmeibacter sp. MSK16QG-6]MCP1198118.1 c-type cytochrome biogenesis protein CcmI [Notoacmeibacter sp. MSK16QG-6]